MPKTATREKPCLFAGPMVKAILSGQKTMTRRAIGLPTLRKSETPGYDWTWRGQAPVRSIAQQKRHPRGCWQDVTHEKFLSILPYQVGDRLWVRETFQWSYPSEVPEREAVRADWAAREGKRPEGSELHYKATELLPLIIDTEGDEVGWRPSIHMPRWAARLFLEVTEVRVERLQDITAQDAWNEGCRCSCTAPVPMCKGNIEAFRTLWDSLSKPDSQWADNPYVMAITFKRREAPQ